MAIQSYWQREIMWNPEPSIYKTQDFFDLNSPYLWFALKKKATSPGCNGRSSHREPTDYNVLSGRCPNLGYTDSIRFLTPQLAFPTGTSWWTIKSRGIQLLDKAILVPTILHDLIESRKPYIAVIRPLSLIVDDCCVSSGDFPGKCM